jgi:hypothetical protein
MNYYPIDILWLRESKAQSSDFQSNGQSEMCPIDIFDRTDKTSALTFGAVGLSLAIGYILNERSCGEKAFFSPCSHPCVGAYS